MKIFTFSFLVFLMSLNIAVAIAEDGKSIDGTSVKSTTVKFLQSQVEGGLSIETALSSLLERYPEHSSDIVRAAFKAYPKKYEEVLAVSISSNPSFIDEIIMVAIEEDVADTIEIVELAIMADPSYAEDVTKAACKYEPEYFNDIVKIAVQTEPDSADQIAKKLVGAYPSRTFEVLITAVKEVPFVGKYILDALLATVEDDPSKSNDMIIISVEQLAQHPDAINRLVALAEQRQIDAQIVKDSAIKGGLDEVSIVAIIDEHYQ